MFPAEPDREAASEWGRLAGLWHDLGKFLDEFQNYLQPACRDSHEGEGYANRLHVAPHAGSAD